MDDDDSSDELHIDEGQDYSASNTVAHARDTRSAHNAGAYNALFSFSGRGHTANSISHSDSMNVSSMVSSSAFTPGDNTNDSSNAGAKSRNFEKSASRKSSRTPASTKSKDYYYTYAGRTTAEKRFSSSDFQREHNNMMITNASNLGAMTNTDRNARHGIKRTLPNHVR